LASEFVSECVTAGTSFRHIHGQARAGLPSSRGAGAERAGGPPRTAPRAGLPTEWQAELLGLVLVGN